MAVTPAYVSGKAYSLTLDDTYLYWTNEYGIGRKRLDGTAPAEPEWVALPGAGEITYSNRPDGQDLIVQLAQEAPGRLGRVSIDGSDVDAEWAAPEGEEDIYGFNSGIVAIDRFLFFGNEGSSIPDPDTASFIGRIPVSRKKVEESEVEREWLPDDFLYEGAPHRLWTGFDNGGLTADGHYLYFLQTDNPEKEDIGIVGRVDFSGGEINYDWLNLIPKHEPEIFAVGGGYIYFAEGMFPPGGEPFLFIQRKLLGEGATQPRFTPIPRRIGQMAIDPRAEYLYFTYHDSNDIGRVKLPAPITFSETMTLASRAQAISSVSDFTVAAAQLAVTPESVVAGEPEASEATIAERSLVLLDSGHDITLISPLLNITPEQAGEAVIGEAEPEPGAYTLSERIIALAERGYDFELVANILNVSPETVQAVLADPSEEATEIPEPEEE